MEAVYTINLPSLRILRHRLEESEGIDEISKQNDGGLLIFQVHKCDISTQYHRLTIYPKLIEMSLLSQNETASKDCHLKFTS